jgi:hypothetical protein
MQAICLSFSKKPAKIFGRVAFYKKKIKTISFIKIRSQLFQI